MTTAKQTNDHLDALLQAEGPTCLIIKAKLQPVGDIDRFQPAGFPEIGHILYDSPKKEKGKICIVDSPASMANHLEAICLAGPNEAELHPDLAGLPYVVCTTDNKQQDDGTDAKSNPERAHDKKVCTSLTEGHRIASDYFLDGLIKPRWVEEKKVTKKGGKEGTIPARWEWKTFRAQLREDFGIVEVKKDKTYFIHPENWWTIYQTIFSYDANSLVHGVMFAKEQIKLSRLLTAHLEAFGASRVGRSGVKFDRLGKTVSGQPIFAVDEETAREIRATFIFDLALLRSYGRNENGLNHDQKRLLLGLALWKVKQLLAQPFRFRTQCYLRCTEVEVNPERGSAEVAAKAQAEQQAVAKEEKGNESEKEKLPPLFESLAISGLITACKFRANPVTPVYYPIGELFKPEKEEEEKTDQTDDGSGEQQATED